MGMEVSDVRETFLGARKIFLNVSALIITLAMIVALVVGASRLLALVL